MNFVGFDFHGKVAFKRMPVRRDFQLSSRLYRPSLLFKEQCVQLLRRDFFPSPHAFEEMVEKGDFESLLKAFSADFFFTNETWVFHVKIKPPKQSFQPSEDGYEKTLAKVVRFGLFIEKYSVLANLSEFRWKKMPSLSDDEIYSRLFEMKRLQAFLSTTSETSSSASLIFESFKNNPFSKNTDQILKLIPKMLSNCSLKRKSV